ncbi:MAG: tetratricopeptide repeat protein, partial [Planctomycetota bacterium]
MFGGSMRSCLLTMFCIVMVRQAIGFEAGELVVARETVGLRNSGSVSDTVGPGQILTVHRSEATRLWVSRGKPGWVSTDQVFGLEEAAEHFSRPFETGANARNYQIRGTIRIALGNTEEGLADLRRAVELSADPTELLESLAYAELKCQLHRQAIATFTKVIDANAKAASALMGRGLALYQAGQQNGSRSDFQRAVALEPDHSFARKYLGAILHDDGRLEEALGHLERAVEIDPFDVFARKARGRLLFDLSQYEQALSDFRVAAKGDPADVEAAAGLGVIRHAMGVLVEAESDFVAAIELAEPTHDFAFLWSNLGQVRMERGDFTAAREALDQAIALDPHFDEARSHRAYLSAIDPESSDAGLSQAKVDLRRVLVASAEPT